MDKADLAKAESVEAVPADTASSIDSEMDDFFVVTAGAFEAEIHVARGGWPPTLCRADGVVTTVLMALTAEADAGAFALPSRTRRHHVSIRLTDDAEVAQINAEWRSKTGPTNVLSFPAHDDIVSADAALIQASEKDLNVQGGNAHTVQQERAVLLLGDLVFAFETIVQEANALGIAFDDHMTHLVVHGILHCLGYDHQDDTDAEAMEGLEGMILARLDIADPYATVPSSTA